MNKTELTQQAEALLTKCSDLILTSVTEAGYPRSCMLCKLAQDGYTTVYVSTGGFGTKAQNFRRNPKASVCYFVGPESVTLTGDVSFVTDAETRHRCWADWMFAHFPDGPDSEEFCLLKFTGKEATFWINGEFLRDEPV